jgi:translation elongation factor EF-Tu-like GTPase
MTDILVRARIYLLAESDGGRSSAVAALYRPNHNFGSAVSRLMHIGQIEFIDGEPLAFGQDKEAMVRFLDAGNLREYLYPNREWRIQEGQRLVGRGVVLEVLR